MIGDYSKALAQVFDRRFLGVLLKAVALTVALLAGLTGLFIYAVSFIPSVSFTIPLVDYQVAFLDEVATTVSIGLILLLSTFLMFPVAAVFVGVFLDEIADAVEARHYPRLPPARRQTWGEITTQSVEFLAVMIAANAVALIFYLLATVFAPAVFWIVNGYLIGREYFEVVAMRRVSREEARRLRKRYLLPIWLSGAVIAVPLSVPILNVIVPLVGVAVFVHLYHRKIGRADAAARPGTA